MTDRLRVTLGWVLAGLTVVALYMSWPALYDAAIHIGGMSPSKALGFPVVVDLVTIAAMLLVLLVPNPSRPARAFAWITLSVFGIITVAGNASEAMLVDPDRLVLGIGPATLVNSIPAIALLMTTHLASINVFKRGLVESVPEAAPAPRVKRADTRPRTRRTTRSADQEAVIALQGKHSLGDIAAMTGVPKSTVSRWLRTPALVEE